MSLVQAYKNFSYRLEALDPDGLNETGLCAHGFRHYDPYASGKSIQGSGNLRRFYVRTRRGDELSAATDADRREAWHVFEVYVDYPRVHEHGEMYHLILADLDDIIQTLRDSKRTNMLGYDADNDTADTGMFARIYQGYEITESTDVWQLATGWRCKVRESEI